MGELFPFSPSSACVVEFQIFSTPCYHPKSKPFVDHILSFSVDDNRIWFRNFQVSNCNAFICLRFCSVRSLTWLRLFLHSSYFARSLVILLFCCLTRTYGMERLDKGPKHHRKSSSELRRQS